LNVRTPPYLISYLFLFLNSTANQRIYFSNFFLFTIFCLKIFRPCRILATGKLMPPPAFQINSKSIFLTVPQCDFPLIEFHSNICSFFGDNLLHGVVSRECHQDGNFHLHAAFTLKSALRTSSPSVLDHLAMKHPDIQTRFKGGAKKAYKYVAKDGDFLPLPNEQVFDLTEFLAGKEDTTKSMAIVTLIKEGASLDAVDDQQPAYMLQHLQMVERYHSFCELKKKRFEFATAQTSKVLVEPASLYSSVWNRAIASWLSRNLRTPRAHRQKQLWIQAPPGAGKTSLIMWLETTFNLSIYFWPRDEKWWDGYSDGAFDLIVLDEYRAQKMITELNPVLSGDPTPLSRRSTFPLVKRDNLPVIILSNFHPEECYHKVAPSQLAPLLDRLTIVKVEDVIRIVERGPPLNDDNSGIQLEAPPVAESSFGDLDLPTEEELGIARAGFGTGSEEDFRYDPWTCEWVPFH